MSIMLLLQCCCKYRKCHQLETASQTSNRAGASNIETMKIQLLTTT